MSPRWTPPTSVLWVIVSELSFSATRDHFRGSLRMLLEVGPSLGSRQAAVDVRDARGRTLLHTTLFGRGVVLVPVQLQPGENELVVHVTSPNKPAPHERRILNLRLFNAVALR